MLWRTDSDPLEDDDGSGVTPTRVLLVFVAAMVLAGCAHRRTQTSRQLPKGEEVTSVNLDSPGTLVVPRLSGQWVRGLGPGDVNLHLGTTFFSVGGGGGGRLYLSDLVNLEGHLMYKFFPDEGTQDEIPTSHYLFPRVGVSTSTTDERIVYGGTDVQTVVGLPVSEEYVGAVHTLRVGVEPKIGSSTTLQFELAVPTVSWFTSGGFTYLSPGAANPGNPSEALFVHGVQLSMGVNWGGL
jgi:hypothetical protein